MTDQQFEGLKELIRQHCRIIRHLQGMYFKETGQRFEPAFIGELDDAETEKIEAMLNGTK